MIGFLFVLKMLIQALLGSIRKQREAKKIATGLCPHGLAGGKIQLKSPPGSMALFKCHQCTEDEHRAREQEQLEIRRQELAVKIRAAADELKTAEYTRLTKLRTHKIDYLLRLSPGEFEEIVGQMYSRFGYSVERTPMSNDFGRDLILQKDGKTTFVECKRYDKDMSIGRRPLQLFYGAMMNMKADAGIFVTTSYFARTAINFAGETNMQLVDGLTLAEMMARAFPTEGNINEYRALCRECGEIVVFDLRDQTGEMSCPKNHLVRNDSPDSLAIRLISEAPTCEKCGAKMRLVNGRFGKFWGCSKYPKCRSKRRYFSRQVNAQ